MTVDRYDYLEFKDSHGKTVKCDEKVGTSSWPKVVKFPNCSRLQFSFHSDSSGVDWGYKFKVHVRFFSSYTDLACLCLVNMSQFGKVVNFVREKFSHCTQTYFYKHGTHERMVF